MSERVKWSTNIEVLNGPVFNFGSVVQPEAYEKIQVMVESEGDGAAVSILPAADVTAEFLLIKASKYVDPDDPTLKLTYTVGGTERNLQGPLVMTNGEMLGLFGDDLTQIAFKNSMAEPVKVEILVCRNAGPSA